MRLEALLTPAPRHVLACATVMEEMLPLLPAGVSYQVLDFGLHVNPANLKRALQDAIDGAADRADTVILGYGLCSMAVIGLRAHGCTLSENRIHHHGIPGQVAGEGQAARSDGRGLRVSVRVRSYCFDRASGREGGRWRRHARARRLQAPGTQRYTCEGDYTR